MEQLNNLTKEQQDKLKVMLKHAMPELAKLGQFYCAKYPLEDTSSEVVDAVTVSVSLRTFFTLGAIVSNIAVDLLGDKNVNG